MEKKERQSVTQIQSELNRILKHRTNSEACLFNLIVYTQEPQRTAYFTEVVNMIRKQFPCRIIFITENRSSKENDFQVHTVCEKDVDGGGFLCDQIFIQVSGQDIQQVYFLLFPLLVPDLPIYLLWGQDPTTEYTILPNLEHFATRLIFDAETTEDLQQFSRNMLNRMHSSSIQIIDMNWARIGGWREILAQIFDSSERLDQLANSNSIEFFYNDLPSELFNHPDTQAVYLQAWLASRLQWKFIKAEKENGSQIIYYQSCDQSRYIRLTPKTATDFESQDILGAEIYGNNGYECHIKRSSPEQVNIQSSNQFQCGLPFVLLMPILGSGRNFMQEIFYQKISNQYEPMLQLISLTRWS